MGIKTGRIRYNLTQRGREHIGKDRKFDLRAMAALVNSPAVQERVKNRDLLGYYGHHIRMRFGLTPPEWVVVDGKQINIEPAIVTTHLSADENGNIEHETEFLDTAAGKIAARLYDSRTGGFSSAIHATPRGNFDVPTIFAGFDYVFEPNFTTNRGYQFDSTGMSGDMVFDSVMAEWNQSNAAMVAIYDSLQADHTRAMETLAKLQEENEELLSLLARGGAAGQLVLDAVGGPHATPMLLDRRATAAFEHRATAFAGATLPAMQKLPEEEPKDDGSMDRINRHYGIGK